MCTILVHLNSSIYGKKEEDHSKKRLHWCCSVEVWHSLLPYCHIAHWLLPVACWLQYCPLFAMLPVLPRKQLSFVLLTQVFVLMQHFLPAHRTRRLSILCGAQKCLSRIVLLRCPLPHAIPNPSKSNLAQLFWPHTHHRIQPNSRCHCWPRCCPPPRISGGELKCQTWKMYMCEFLPASACFYPQFNLGFCNWQIIQLQTIGNRTDAPRKALDWLLSVLL